MHAILRNLSVGGHTAGIVLAWLLSFGAAAQGVLNTAPGVTLAGATRSVVFEGGLPGPLLKLSFGFSTDEIPRPGVIPDSFTITIQDTVANQSLVLVNMDAAGTVWAPMTPGTVPLPPESIDHAPIPYSSLTPVLASRTAYEIELTLPAGFQGRPLTLFYDLFSNDNGEASQAWFSDAVVVPEPGVGALLVLGGLGIWWRNRRPAGTRRRGTSFLVFLALCLWMGADGSVRAAEKAFRINDTDLVLAEVTPDADVYFRSMRLNRALNVWNVELVVSNKSGRTLNGPLVLLVDSFQGTSGLVGPDGLDDSQPAKAYLDLSAAAGNGSLSPGEMTSSRTLTLGRSAAGSPSLATRLFAARPPTVATLGVTRSLDGVGQPLPGVLLTGTGASGALNQRTDSPSGVASFGRSAGEHQVRFSLEGYLPVWRREILAADQTTVVPNPRLTARSRSAFSITPLGGSVITNSDASVVLQVPPGAVQEPVTATLTPLSGQSLPAFLPKGWSPLASFWLEISAAFRGALPGELKPWGAILPSETAAWARWDEQRLEWIVEGTVAGRGSNAVPVEIHSPGAYVLVVGDSGELAPPAPISGQALAGSSTPSPEIAGLSASGTVTPSFSPASRNPEQVTGIAHMVVRHASSALPSGTLFRGEVTETYHLRDGGLRLSPQYEGFLVGYQRPGDGDVRTLDAEFPMRPLLLFGPDQLSEATVRMEVMPEQPFDGQVLDATGGQISSGSIRLVAGVGRLSVPSALRLRRLDATAFTNLVAEGDAVVAAFDLTLDSSTLSGNLSAQVSGLASGSRFVLARILSETGYHGLQPVERLQSDAAGSLRSLEPTTGERLPGVSGSGQYVLVSVAQPQGLVSGIARDGGGIARSGLPVSLAGLPWLALTDSDGRYRLVAPAGTRELTVRDPATGDAGIVSVTVTDAGSGLSQDLGTAPHGPRVARITPAAGAVRIPRVGSVVVEFDEAVNPGSVVDGIQLLKPDNSAVPASLSLNLANRVATLSPANELDANTTYRVRLAPTIRDPGGLPLEGTNEFTFTTVPLSTRDPAAQLIIYQPGATNVPASVLAGIPAYTPGSDPSAIVVHGTPGTADPEVAVILVNESTGETATVLSKPDGSFSNVIPGSEQDFVSATFVNLNGTRVYVPVSRQLFDNGFVGLYPQGGILEAQSDGGPVQVLIKPNAVPSRTKFRVKTLTRAQLLQETGGVTPDVATLGPSAMRIELEGSAPREPMEIRFPVNLAQMGYPTNESPNEVAAALAVVRNQQGTTTFEVADQMLFEPAATPLNRGARAGSGRIVRQDLGEDFAGALYTVVGFAPSLAVGLTPLFFDFVVVPILLGNKPILIKGITQQLPKEAYNPSTGLIESVSEAINDAAEEYFAAKENVVPVQGAFVILRPSTNPASSLPGRLNPGTVHATSGADGSYLMIAPSASQDYILSATHPGFVDRPGLSVKGVRDVKFSGFVFKRLIFHTLNVADTPLRLNVAHAPQYPAPNTDCDLQVSAFRGAGASPDILVTVKSVTNLVAGDPAKFSDVTISNVTLSANGVTRVWKGTVRATKPVQAVFQITADGVVSRYPISFSGVIPPVITGPLPKPDTNDVHGPLVVSTFPPEGGYLPTSGEMTILFNKPIDRGVEQALSGVVLDGPNSPATPIIRLDAGQQALSIRYVGLEPDREYTLTLTSEAIRDLAGQPLDQRPSTPETDSFRLRFRSSPVRSVVLPGMGTGRGTVISGSTLYAIEVSSTGGALLAFDISNPALPSLSRRQPLPGQPRDLVLIPKYSYRRTLGAPNETNDLVAVVGGELDTYRDQFGNTQVQGQYLAVYNMMHPDGPQRLASPMVTYRVGSVVSKVRWSPPNLIYQEFGSDIQQLVAVDLQEMMVAFGGIPQEFIDRFGADGRPGVDNNRDGDYVDDGELLPIPRIPSPEFAGRRFGYVLSGTTQRILDFSPVAAGQVIGVTLTRGAQRGDSGEIFGHIPPAYRTLSLNLNTADPGNAMYRFPETAYPRWVAIFPSLTILSNDVPLLPTVALVSLQPDAEGKQSLAILDVSLPQTPRLINQIRIPEELLGGPMQSIRQREDGLLELAGSQHLVMLDSRRFAVTNVASGQAHPSIVGFLASGGAGTRSLGSTPYGYHSVAEGARTVLIQTPPTLRFVNFPSADSIVRPSELAGRSEAEVAELMQGIRVTAAIPPARAKANAKAEIISTLDPPLPAAHFYVLMSAPGDSGRSIELGLESVNHAGRPLNNFGVGFAPVRAISASAQESIGQKPRADCGAPIRSLTAWRISNDPKSPYFNQYLSRPFALLANESLSAAEQKRFQQQEDREILHSGAGLRVFIDPVEAKNAVLGPFVARVDEKRKLLLPVSSAQALTLYHPYLMGDNPPPPGGIVPLPGTFGMVAAHSSEVRTEAEDMSLPSRRMPIVIRRAIGNQDQYEGPFGVGWDFNYNQRITELDPLSFPLGLQMPVILRGSKADSDIAGSQDILFNTGMGRVLRFRWVSTNMPPEYAQDPLVRDWDYQTIVSDYYLPARVQGSFDLLVKLKDGRFERVTPEGERYRYSSSGRLEMILDRFPLNRHELEYDRNGWLIRIDDRSVRSPRYVDFGYYRTADDPDFRDHLDEVTTNPVLDGKIRRLRNFAGADVLFVYDANGFLIRRDGIQVDGENGGFSGRAQTHYSYKDCRFVGVKVTAAGTPLFTADVIENANGKPVVVQGVGIGGSVGVDIPKENSAATLTDQTGAASLADTTRAAFQFDKFGHLKSAQSSGRGSAATEMVLAANDDGLPTSIRHPEGNLETLEYDSANPVFRSRANLIRHTISPGPRGGEGFTQEFRYDPRYNLRSGVQRDANGFEITYRLTSNGRALESIEYGAVGTDRLAYNDFGQLISQENAYGVVTETEYDATTGFEESHHVGDNEYLFYYGGGYSSQMGMASEVTLPEGDPVLRTYNRKLQLVEQSRGKLRELRGYDEQGRTVFQKRFLGDGRTPVVRQEFDEKGFLKRSVTEGVEVDGVVGNVEYVFTPDEMSRVKSIQFPQGSTQTHDFDHLGRLVRRTVGDYIEEYGLDGNGNTLTVKKGGELVESRTFDGLDRTVSVTAHIGKKLETVELGYFRGGQPRSRRLIDDTFGVVESLEYGGIDELGRPYSLKINGTTVSPEHQYTYEPNSQTEIGPRMTIRSTWNTAGHPTQRTTAVLTEDFTPDGNGRVREIKRTEDGAVYQEFFGFDALDNPESHRDSLGTVFTYTARADGRLQRIVNARDHVTTLEHSALGEPILQRRGDGMEVRHQWDSLRRPSYVGDPTAGTRNHFDGTHRLDSVTQRNGAQTTFKDFDPQRQPQSATIPGGDVTLRYDQKRRMTERTVKFLNTVYSEKRTYDALDRVRIHQYQQDGSQQNTATYNYDTAGPILWAQYQEDGRTFVVNYAYYADLSRKTLTYPSGYVVDEQRDNSGRLLGISDTNGVVARVTAWQGNEQPRKVELGGGIDVENRYDARGRVLSMRAVRVPGGEVLAHMRYQYDAANNLERRQYLHRGGRADRFGYDDGERLNVASVGGLPSAGDAETYARYTRGYTYSEGGLDFLTSVSTTPLGLDPPSFASSWSGHDGFLLPGTVDAFDRSPADPRGNVQHAVVPVRQEFDRVPKSQAVSFLHNGNGNLVSVRREDDLIEENYFQPDGLRYRKRLVRREQVLDDRHFVYDTDGRLLEEFDRTTGGAFLIARYFYLNSDAPVAADLYDYATGVTSRYYYLKDATESVIAVADASGKVLERAWYDPFGQPKLESRDELGPALKQVSSASDGSLLIALSESVLPPVTDPGVGEGVVPIPAVSAEGLVTVTLNSVPVGGTLELLPEREGFAPYSVLRFTPAAPIPVTPTGVLGWWPGDGSVLDVIGGNNGALRGGAVAGAGVNQQAFALNGTSAFVEITNAAALNVGAGDFTVSTWVRFDSLAGEQVLVEKWVDSSRSGWSLAKSSDQRWRLVLGSGGGVEQVVQSAPGLLPTNQWIQVAARRQGNQFTILTNGTVVATGVQNVNLNSTATLKFGSREGRAGFLRGGVDEVTLHGRALSDQELASVAGGVSLPGPLNVTLVEGRVADEWGNLNTGGEVAFLPVQEDGVVYYEAQPDPQTAASEQARSTVGSPILFHGQYFDYETGLIYLRARFYDPFSGMFLEPDPHGYQDSVNPYAAMGNNPVGRRDPSGRGFMSWMFGRLASMGARASSRVVLREAAVETMGAARTPLLNTAADGLADAWVLERAVAETTEKAPLLAEHLEAVKGVVGGDDLLILGLKTSILETAVKLKGKTHMASTDFRNAVLGSIALKERMIVDVAGMSGRTLLQRIENAVAREAGATLRVVGKADHVIDTLKGPWATDWEMYQLWSHGLLPEVQFVERVGETVYELANPFVRNAEVAAKVAEAAPSATYVLSPLAQWGPRQSAWNGMVQFGIHANRARQDLPPPVETRPNP